MPLIIIELQSALKLAEEWTYHDDGMAHAGRRRVRGGGWGDLRSDREWTAVRCCRRCRARSRGGANEAHAKEDTMNWENLLFLIGGALLARPVWPVVRGVWVWLVALCLARHVRLGALGEDVPRGAPLDRVLYGWAWRGLYPPVLRTQARDDEIQDAIWDTEDRHIRRKLPRSCAFDVTLITTTTPRGREIEAQRIRARVEERKEVRRRASP